MKPIIGLAAALLLCGCATTQLTSGADYNRRTVAITQSMNYGSIPSIDAEIAEIAAVEPNLVFPARIGIAHLHKGRLVAVPTDHWQAWSPLTERIQPDYGEIVPISPLIAQMVAKPDRGSTAEIVNGIRRGAARQHVDYVLIYETDNLDSRRKSNALSFTDLSIIGLFILPSRSVEVEATASALFLDVRNGYPYGTASGIATKDGISTVTNASAKTQRLGDRAALAAVEHLAEDVEVMFDTLIAETVTRQSAQLGD